MRVAGTVEATSSDGTVTADAIRLDLFTVVSGQATYFDDLLVQNDAYPGDIRLIARQGKTGAPTYDTWTKTGGDGTAAGVWSDTPPDDTTLCTSPSDAGTQRQTMLVAAFDAGVDPIGASDTIVACKVVARARRSAGAARDFYILRRLDGVDTETLIEGALTTTYGYMDDAVWSDTLANLNAMEAGARRTASMSGGQTFAVADVWVMVAYTPSPGAPAPSVSDTVAAA